MLPLFNSMVYNFIVPYFLKFGNIYGIFVVGFTLL